MGAVAFLVLFILGLLLATVGGIIGLVDAFKVSPVWGLLSLFIPFVLLFFCVKFWNRRKWARNSLVLSLAGLGSMLLSVPFLGGFMAQRLANQGETQENVSLDDVPLDDVPLDGVPIEVEPLPDGSGEVFVEPLVPAAPQLASLARAELIQSTDPDQRIQQINNSRPDPFATVPIPPKPRVAPPPAPVTTPAGGVSPVPGGTPPAGAGPGTGTAPTTTQPSPGAVAGNGQSGTGQAGTTGTGPGSPIAPLPELPKATLANGVLVSGVVKIGNENFAILQSPGEASSRYVKSGQRVANGRVLVKRIDVGGSEPMVVLEENGIEVRRPVGGLPEPTEPVPGETATPQLVPLRPLG